MVHPDAESAARTQVDLPSLETVEPDTDKCAHGCDRDQHDPRELFIDQRGRCAAKERGHKGVSDDDDEAPPS